jgi:hypothetical protein
MWTGQALAGLAGATLVVLIANHYRGEVPADLPLQATKTKAW